MREKGTLMTTPGPADDASPSVAATSPSLVPVRRTPFGESQQARPRGQSFSAELSTDDELDMASLASEVSRQRRGSTINSQDGYRPQQQHHAVPVQSYNTAITPPAKRKLGVLQEDGDAGFDVDFDSDEERQLMQLADASAEKFRQSQAAESSVARGDSFTTPSARRTRNAPGDLPTPLTRNSLPIASEQREATAKRQRTEVAAAATPATTPTPARSTGTGHDGSSGIFGGDDYDITEEVMGLLGEGPAVTDAARHGIRDALNRYALRVRGIERGREMARATVKAKDGRIAELQARVAALENERRVNKERIKALNTGLKSLYGEDLSET